MHPHFVKDLGFFHNNNSLPLNKTCPARQLTVSNKLLVIGSITKGFPFQEDQPRIDPEF
jgi:hypothetical protein